LAPTPWPAAAATTPTSSTTPATASTKPQPARHRPSTGVGQLHLGANLEHLTLTGAAAITGTGNALANFLTGNDGANTLIGGAGNDTLYGGLGADSLAGGTGNDTYIVDDTSDDIGEAAAGGTDTVRSSVSYTLGANLENLTLTGADAINGTGNSLANILTGNDGANILAGEGGNDTYYVAPTTLLSKMPAKASTSSTPRSPSPSAPTSKT
jgi:Ca2+-binding RTX toxin-like protein